MKFFTPDAYNSWYGPVHPFEDSSGLDAAARDYQRHLESLEGILPADVLELARLNGVDDGLVVEVHHIATQRVLVLVLRCGDQLMGYFDLVITYEDAEMTPRDEWTLAKIARETKGAWLHASDLFYHELDVTDDGRIEHRFLFHSAPSFAVRCRALQWRKVERPDRELPRLPDRFPGGPTRPPGRPGSRRVRPEPHRR